MPLELTITADHRFRFAVEGHEPVECAIPEAERAVVHALLWLCAASPGRAGFANGEHAAAGVVLRITEAELPRLPPDVQRKLIGLLSRLMSISLDELHR